MRDPSDHVRPLRGRQRHEAERNGLSPMELMWAIEGRGLRWPLNDSDAEAVPRLIAALAAPPPPTDGKEQP
jgi:hypothetical protein